MENYLKLLQEQRKIIHTELIKHNVIVGNGITKKTEGYEVPIITCKNATSTLPVIEISYGKNSDKKIEKEGYCLKIKAIDEYEMIKIENALLYKLWGVN